MSAREISDRVVRHHIAECMADERARRRYKQVEPHDVLEAAVRQAADQCARFLASGELSLAHAEARVHAQLLASQRRMYARWTARDAAEVQS